MTVAAAANGFCYEAPAACALRTRPPVSVARHPTYDHRISFLPLASFPHLPTGPRRDMDPLGRRLLAVCLPVRVRSNERVCALVDQRRMRWMSRGSARGGSGAAGRGSSWRRRRRSVESGRGRLRRTRPRRVRWAAILCPLWAHLRGAETLSGTLMTAGAPVFLEVLCLLHPGIQCY